MDLSHRLRAARRPNRVSLSDEQRDKIKEVIKQGVSKKAICLIYSIDYTEIKNICRT